MNDNFQEVLFCIPETYFVVVLETVSEKCLKVQYDRYVGYVKNSSIILATFTPIVKTLSNVTFDIKQSSGTQIWQYPTTQSDVCTTIGAGVKNIRYIASVQGVIPYGGQSDVWFYVQYIPDVNSTNVYEGYIYSENTTNLSPIVSNLEVNPEVISDEWKNDNILLISSTIKTIIIAIIAIPIILFFAIILYKTIKKFKKNTKYNQNTNEVSEVSIDEFTKQRNTKFIEKFKNLTLLKNKKIDPHFVHFDDDELL